MKERRAKTSPIETVVVPRLHCKIKIWSDWWVSPKKWNAWKFVQ